MKKNLIIALIALLLNHLVFPQNIDKTKLDNYFEVLEKNNKFMGSVTISKNGKLIYTKSCGFTDVKNKRKANERTKYRIGSISKTFTTVLIFKAIEENKLSLDQTIDHYFPTIKNASKITINHLLYHRSGIHDFTTNKNYYDWNTKTKTEAEMVDTIAKGGSDFEPDSIADYSNSNFVLLSLILEKTYNKTYSDILTTYIIKPAGLKNTHFGGEINNENNEAGSFMYIGKWEVSPETNLSIPMGAGAIVSTPSDLVKFSEALFAEKIISAKSVEEMKTIKENYGRGLYKILFEDKTAFGHTGGIDGFVSVFNYFPDDKITFAIICNGVNYDLKNIRTTVLNAVYNKPFSIPGFYRPTPDELDKYTGTYSSDKIPVKIIIARENELLIAQIPGNTSFPLDPVEKNKFRFERGKINMEFNSVEKTMLLKQGEQQMVFTKE